MMKDDVHLKRFVDAIPKVELHAHLNGCIRASTLFELARERGIRLPNHHFGDELDDDTQNDVGHMYNSKPRSLVDCFEMFAEVSRAVSDLPALRRITWEALEDFALHRVAYLELRSTPKRLKRRWDVEEITSRLCYIECIESVFRDFVEQEQERYERDKNLVKDCRLPLVPRLLVSIDRSRSVQEAKEIVDLAIDLHAIGNFVVGIDLGGNPLQNDFRDFESVLAKARASGLKMTIHCGEVFCAEDERAQDPRHIIALQEAKALIAFKPDRLGHALLLPKSVRPQLAEARIPVECCPTSNVMTLELARKCEGCLVGGLQSHPQLEYWLDTDYPFSISTDDSGVFNTNPSKELLLLGIAWNLGPSTLKHIVLQSLDHGFCDESTKKLIRERMVSHFQNFEAENAE